ncbi:MAG: B12-binding domain-containing radical SAM protein [Candidatus Aenigmarchaeota archaeon]|nr:B12-binding domain-containing radical SAM protein [Candidatus Aenigmarchaeota archaeon]
MESILLIQPNYRHTKETGVWMVNVPLGLCYIAAVLRNKGFKTEILDANALNLSPEETAKHAVGFDAVGVSGMTPAHGFIKELANCLPKTTLKIAGGPHASGFPEKLLDAGYDVVVRGEGEYTILEIMEGKEYGQIKGLSYRKGSKIFHNQDREPIDPDSIPLPARDLLPSNGVDMPYQGMGVQYMPWSPIFTSRGCPFDCYFCNKKVFGRCFRKRSPESVLNEVEMLVKQYGVKEIDIYDDTFNADLARAEKIVDMIIERKLDIKIRFSNGIRADKITESFLRKLKKAGCIYIAYGIESGNQDVLDRLGKNLKLEQVRFAVKLTKKIGIPVTGFFVLGLLGDNEKTMQQTIDFAKELDLDIAQFTIATPYPGTKFHELVKQNGKFLTEEWENVYHSSGKMVYTYPGTASPEIVEEMYKKAFREFYFRPSYLIKKIARIRSIGELKMIFRGVKSIIRIGA